MNGHDLSYTVDDAEILVLSVAQGQFDVDTIAANLAEHLILTD